MTEAIRLTLPDGSVRSMPSGSTPLDVAAGIGPRLAKDAVGAEIDGKKVDLRQPLRADGAFRIFTTKSPEAGEFIRHSAEHVLADAVKRLWPEVEIDAGRQDHSEKFQYDFRFSRAFTPEDLEKIEAKMREIVAEKSPFERIEVSREEAATIFAGMGETLKVERLKDIPEGEAITLYRHGRFTDLCRGPHAQTAGQIGAVKLLEASGVYWKGDEKNERLQRIYGTAFGSEKEMAEYMEHQEQARARDHRRIGTELDLFSFNAAAPATPFLHPKGAFIYNSLIELRAGALRPLRLWRGRHAADPRRRAVEDLRALRQLPRCDVLHGSGREAVRGQADELPDPLPDLRHPAALVPRAADPLCRLRPPAPLRAQRRHQRPVPGPLVLPGRRAHLLHRGADRGRGAGRRRDDPGGLHDLRLRGRADRAVHPAGEADRLGRAVGPRRGGAQGGARQAGPGLSGQRGRRCLLRAEDRLPRPATPWDGAGSSAPCSSTTRCPPASASPMWGPTAPSTSR